MYSTSLDARLEGMIAFTAGKQLDENPYPIGHMFYTSWEAGWADARKVDRIESEINYDEGY